MKIGKKILYFVAGVVLSAAIFFGISGIGQKKSEDIILSPTQQSNSDFLNFYPEDEIKTSQKVMQKLLTLINVTDQPDETTPDAARSLTVAPDFSDVKETDWYYREVMWAVGENITNGVSENRFDPSAPCKKDQVLTFLWRSYGMPKTTVSNPFIDVPSDSFFYQPALWAYEKGLVSGSTFSPETDCTRAMVVDYLWKAAGAPVTAGTTQFSDISASISQAVTWAVDNGITAGIDNSTFAPDVICTRAQIVTFLYRNYIYLNAEMKSAGLSSGASYRGTMIDGVPYGKGLLVIPGIGYYDGEFQNGKRSGTGSFFWESGETYTGSWKEDKISGNGIFALNTGTALKGQFSNSTMLSGTYTFSKDFGTVEFPVTNGSIQFPANVTISLLDGSTYVGNMVNGKLNGSCTITFSNGDKFSGNVIDNLKAGAGVYTWKNGAWYEGNWSGDVMSGTGTYYYTSLNEQN